MAFPAGQDVELQFGEAAVISGIVVFADGGPAANVGVVAPRSLRVIERVVSDAEGRFELSLPADLGGTVTVRAAYRDKADVRRTVERLSVAPGTEDLRLVIAD